MCAVGHQQPSGGQTVTAFYLEVSGNEKLRNTSQYHSRYETTIRCIDQQPDTHYGKDKHTNPNQERLCRQWVNFHKNNNTTGAETSA
jgi:hypothetical protein